MSRPDEAAQFDQALRAHDRALDRQKEKLDQQGHQLRQIQETVDKLPDEIVAASKASWESVVDVNIRVEKLMASVQEFQETMDAIKAVHAARELADHGREQFRKGRSIGWREGAWAALGAAAMLLAGNRQEAWYAIKMFLRSIGGPGG